MVDYVYLIVVHSVKKTDDLIVGIVCEQYKYSPI